MIDLLVKVAVNAAALLVAANFVPDFKLVFHTDKPEDWLRSSSSPSSSPSSTATSSRS